MVLEKRRRLMLLVLVDVAMAVAVAVVVSGHRQVVRVDHLLLGMDDGVAERRVVVAGKVEVRLVVARRNGDVAVVDVVIALRGRHRSERLIEEGSERGARLKRGVEGAGKAWWVWVGVGVLLMGMRPAGHGGP